MNFRKFKIDSEYYNYLSQEDKRILRILEGVVKDVSNLYKVQLKEGFYPKNVTKKELEEAGKLDASILSPYTFIELKAKQLEAVPYYEKYAQFLKPISQKVEKAASISSNRSFSRYLKARARALLSGNYEDADIAWLDVKSCNIDFYVGPYERYLDKMLFVKGAYQAHVGIIDKRRTDEAENIKEALYTSAKMSPEKYHSTEIPKKGVRVFVEDTPCTAGYVADILMSGEYFPLDLDFLQSYGSKVVFYRSQLIYKFDKLLYPIFKLIFEKRFASKYSKQLLLRATVRNIFLYEFALQLHQFEGSRDRLRELYGIIDEANGFVSGIQHGKHLVVKGLISEDLLEAIIIMHIVWMFADWLMYQKNKAKESHMIGNSMVMNYYFTSGALNEKDGIYWPNFSRMFFEIEEMADTLVSLLRSGTYEEADRLIKKSADFENFKRLSKNLNKLLPEVDKMFSE